MGIVDWYSSLIAETQLLADNISIHFIPAIVTHCPPYSIVANLHSSFSLILSSDQSNIKIITVAASYFEQCMINMRQLWILSHQCKSLQHLHCVYIHWFPSYLCHSLSILYHDCCTEPLISEWVHFPHQSMPLLLGLPSLYTLLSFVNAINCITYCGYIPVVCTLRWHHCYPSHHHTLYPISRPDRPPLDHLYYY